MCSSDLYTLLEDIVILVLVGFEKERGVPVHVPQSPGVDFVRQIREDDVRRRLFREFGLRRVRERLLGKGFRVKQENRQQRGNVNRVQDYVVGPVRGRVINGWVRSHGETVRQVV